MKSYYIFHKIPDALAFRELLCFFVYLRAANVGNFGAFNVEGGGVMGNCAIYFVRGFCRICATSKKQKHRIINGGVLFYFFVSDS